MSTNNLVRQTETFTKWIKGGVRKYIQRLDDNGDWEATTIIEDGEYSTHYIIENFLIDSPGEKGFTIEAKDYGNGRTKLKMLLDGPFIDLEDPSCVFDIDNETASNSAGHLQPMPNGWYRCSLFATTERESPYNLHIMIVHDNGQDDYKGDGESGITIRFPVVEDIPAPPDDDDYVIHGIDDVITNEDDLTIHNI